MPTREQRIGRCAALLAFSNLGFENRIEPRHYQFNRDNPRSWTGRAEYDIVQIASTIIEDETQERLFAEEAAGWEKLMQGSMYDQIVQQFGKNHDWVQEIFIQP